MTNRTDIQYNNKQSLKQIRSIIISKHVFVDHFAAKATVDDTVDNEAAATQARVDPIQRAMGDFGRWHLFVCIVIFLLKFPVAWHQVGPYNVTHTISNN